MTPAVPGPTNELQDRARKFIERPIPDGMTYAPENLTDRFIAEYAQNGSVQLDSELRELLTLCVMEGQFAADSKSGEEGDFFRESHAILQAILDESTS